MVVAKKNRILTYLQTATARQMPHTRIAGAVFCASMLAVVTAFAIAPDSRPDNLPIEIFTVPLSALPVALALDEQDTFLHEEKVRKNDTLPALFNRLAIEDNGALEFVRSDPSARSISRQLRAGKLVSAYTDGSGRLLRLYFPLNGDSDRFLMLERGRDGIKAFEEAASVQRHNEIKSGEIASSLFGATDAAGIPDAVATQLAEIFAGEIDFLRDLRKGDRFAVTYETLSIRGQAVRTGRVLAAEFINGGRTLRALYHASSDESGGYYTPDGKSLRKAFLRSPLEYSRVTSGFSGARLHPVLKEWRAHRGVDYGAARGTKVRTTGDGTIEFIGRQGGYGNLVVVRHPDGYSTAYGHLNGFAPGIRPGTRVSQGNLIGFVGQTGLATGPHLHYEFRVRDVPVDPLAVKLPETPPMDAHALSNFKPAAQEAMAHLAMAHLSTGQSRIE